MGKVKAMCMENEEKFYNLVSDIVSDCDSIQECKERVDLDLVSHLEEDVIDDIVNEIWTEYWWKFAEMNRDNLK